jgi:hypothetical protein
MVIRHPNIGGAKERIIAIASNNRAAVDVKIPAPTGRISAGRMVENPYARYGIADGARSQPGVRLCRP